MRVADGERLRRGADFGIEEHGRNVTLTDAGIRVVESAFRRGNLFAEENLPLLTAVQDSLHAHSLLRRDVDYLVRNGAIQSVDELKGRVAHDRRWPAGLHTAIEAKEGVALKTQGRIDILSRPQVQTMDNQTAYVNIGQSVPYVTASNITAKTAAIRGAFLNVRQAMANAGYADSSYTILAQTYSSPLPNGAGIRYPETGFTRQAVGGCGVWNRDADWANSTKWCCASASAPCSCVSTTRLYRASRYFGSIRSACRYPSRASWYRPSLCATSARS